VQAEITHLPVERLKFENPVLSYATAKAQPLQHPALSKTKGFSVILRKYYINVSYKHVTQPYFFNTDNISFNFNSASTGLMVLMSIFSSISCTAFDLGSISNKLICEVALGSSSNFFLLA
jgi:hypothetical protein